VKFSEKQCSVVISAECLNFSDYHIWLEVEIDTIENLVHVCAWPCATTTS